MKGQFDEFNTKEEQATYLKNFFRHQKRLLIAHQIGDNDYKDTKAMSDLTAIIITLIELEDKYSKLKVNQLDSVMDCLALISPDFYNVSNEIHNTIMKIEECNKKIQKRTKFGVNCDKDVEVKKLYELKLHRLKSKQEKLLYTELK
jgi:hypothetical protein